MSNPGQRRLTGSAGAVLLALWLGSTAGVSAPEARQPIQVVVGDNYYSPDVIRVRAGDAVFFINKGSQLHSLTLIDHEDWLDQVYLKPGASFTFSVPVGLRPGSYSLGCNIHVDMKGTLVVGE